MSVHPTIRLASPEDAESIATMLRLLAGELGDGEAFASTEETVRTHGFGHAPSFATLIAETAREHVGMALFFHHYSTTRGQRGVFVQDLWVEIAHRGTGLGKRLLAAVAAYTAQAWRAEYLALTVYRDNPDAARLYQRLGFIARPNDVSMSLSGDGFVALAEGGA